MIFFTSDEHVGHRNIIEFCKRPFRDLEHMQEELVSRHNFRVTDADTVYHVGDMFWRTLGHDNAKRYMQRLNGKHYYVRGNHEELFDQDGSTLYEEFYGIFERKQIYPEGAPKFGIVLDHYAGRVWHDSDKGNWQLYGHTHNDLPEIDPLLSMDIGVDANGYYPVSLDEVKAKMDAKVKRLLRGLGVSLKKG
jgi:calcineurin-like phosphoesterase family protein